MGSLVALEKGFRRRVIQNCGKGGVRILTLSIFARIGCLLRNCPNLEELKPTSKNLAPLTIYRR